MEREKMLVIRIFPFSNSVFKRPILSAPLKNRVVWKTVDTQIIKFSQFGCNYLKVNIVATWVFPWKPCFLRDHFLAPLAVGQRAYVMVCCPLCVCPVVWSCVHPCVCVLTFSLNIFFSETTYRIWMKFHRNVPGMVLFRISWKNLIPSKTLVAMATKLKFFWNLWKSSCQKP